VAWFDWVDVVVDVAPGELAVPDGEVGAELEVPCDGEVLVGDDVVEVPEPVGTGTFGVVTLGSVTLGVVSTGVVRLGVETLGVVMESAEAEGRAAMPIATPTATSVVIAPTTSFRLHDDVSITFRRRARASGRRRDLLRPPRVIWRLEVRVHENPPPARTSVSASPFRLRVAHSLSAGRHHGSQVANQRLPGALVLRTSAGHSSDQPCLALSASYSGARATRLLARHRLLFALG
jgi:hypothetical protein